MAKVLRVVISDDEWRQLKSLLTHQGHLSHILRQAVRNYIIAHRKKGEERDGKGGHGGGSQEPKIDCGC